MKTPITSNFLEDRLLFFVFMTSKVVYKGTCFYLFIGGFLEHFFWSLKKYFFGLER